LAQLLRADRAVARAPRARHQPRHGQRRGRLRALRQPPAPCLPRRPPAHRRTPLPQLRRPALHRRRGTPARPARARCPRVPAAALRAAASGAAKYPLAPRAPRAPATAQEPAMTQTPPDRLSNDPRSPHYDEAALGRGVGIRFNGEERTNVEEYCVSEGWIRVAVGRALDRRGNPMTM